MAIIGVIGIIIFIFIIIGFWPLWWRIILWVFKMYVTLMFMMFLVLVIVFATMFIYSSIP